MPVPSVAGLAMRVYSKRSKVGNKHKTRVFEGPLCEESTEGSPSDFQGF